MFRRLVTLAGLGVTGVLLSQENTGLLSPVEAACTSGTICYTNSTDANTIEGDNTGLGYGVYGWSGSSVGVFGESVDNYGVQAYSENGIGLYGTSLNDIGGYFAGGTAAIYANGNVGIGTGTPARALHLVGHNANFRMNRDIDTAAFILVRTAAGNFSTVWKTFYVGVNASGVKNGYFFVGDNGANTAGTSTRRLLIDTNGNVGIGSIANTQSTFSNILTLPNTASTAGRGLANAWSTYSSVRWKTNIQPIQGALAMIQRLRGVRFNWKAGGKQDVGLVAEEVGQVLPEVVTYEKNGKDAQSLDYSRLVPVLIQATKELAKQNEQLATRNSEQQKTIERIQERIDVLENSSETVYFELRQQRPCKSTYSVTYSDKSALYYPRTEIWHRMKIRIRCRITPTHLSNCL